MASATNGQAEGLYTYDSFSGNKKKKSDSHFLWWCAGTHQALLRDCPSEHAKYAGLGGVILATFVLASLSAGYAVYSVFDHWAWAVGFAIVWGLIIFNFDRFLVSTMRKYGVSLRKQLWTAFPRMLLALLIGVTIARPLELKIFEKEIDLKVTENRHQKILLNDSLLTAENKNQVSGAEKERLALTLRKQSIEDTLQLLRRSYLEEADGTGGSRQRGFEKITQLKKDAYEHAQAISAPESGALQNRIAVQDSILSNAKSALEIKRKAFESKAGSDVGFLEKNKALSDLSAQESSVFWANLFISLLIIVIETGPILSKLIMSVGPYDLSLAKTELMQMAQSESDMRRDKQLVIDKQDTYYRRKREMSEEMNEKITALQRRHIDDDIERWQRGERNGNGRAAMNELMKKLKDQYEVQEENVL